MSPLFKRRSTTPHRGQALAEFALVFPLMFLILAGIIQFGIIFWAQNTLTQIARDTGRWAASQQSCTLTAPIIAKANAIAAQSSLIGYGAAWTSADVTITWQTTPPSDPCPPTGNQQTSFVTISIHHRIPIFFPFVPGNGDLSSTTQFRMEPANP